MTPPSEPMNARNPRSADAETRRRRVAWAVAAAGAAALAVWLAHRPASDDEGPREGHPPPELRMADLSGQTASWSEYRGKVVLLDFWATWCDSCRAELPDLVRMYPRLHERGLDVLAPSLDEQGRRPLMAFVAQNGVPWRILLGDEEKARAYGVYGLPTKFLVDRDGILVRKYIGPVDLRILQKDVEALLKKEARSS